MVRGVRGVYEDMLERGAATPPEMRAPLAPLGGKPPPAPQWFRDAVAAPHEHGFVATPRGRIEALSWGEVGKPGLLFIHGNGAHAHWWSFLCPLFADSHRVTSMSLAGMGGSDWRDSYGYADYAEDAEAVARATGLYEGGRKPAYIGHSFGGGLVFYVTCRHPERLHSAVIVDTAFTARSEGRLGEQSVSPDLRPQARPVRVYPTEAEALARFRLSPPQPAENLYIADHLARHGLKRAPLPDGSGEGWCWKFDPEMWNKLDREETQTFFASDPEPGVPLAQIYGDHSLMAMIPGVLEPPGPPVPMIAIPEACHHVMLDQPLALTAAIRAVLAARDA
jgi:pimeloyl-ACP methyl ester carboxylesterase